ncbi:SpoVR family protein [Clostridium luticellarii]|uniref:SpoVR family protein n=1 Tax=Clostridium luticellarii TaxID=1691940 RepID=A0A2T0BSL7_9CLOT|nr:SpoVR family protein [Clostridium luticellarii]
MEIPEENTAKRCGRKVISLEYTSMDLRNWCDIIENASRKAGLDFYPQEFEIVDYKDMIGYEAYSGMPSRYPHWSFGKSYDKADSLYKYNISGLPYEMVINSNPCLAYLMKDNSLLLQILTMAHVYGHNDFFKNNRLFKEGTRASYTIEMFKNNADMIREYVNDPSIGYNGVEKILNSAHSIRFQANRTIGMAKPKDDAEEPKDDLIAFIVKHGDLEEWQKNVLNIVRAETAYFLPQIETKIMNEGWASYWHYKTLNQLDLSPSLHLEFIKRHNDVITPLVGMINPYYLGFKMFQDLEKRYGMDKIFEVRALERDESFIRRYLTEELCNEMNLFQYAEKGSNYVVEEISDHSGWTKIRSTLCSTCGINMIPNIVVDDISKKDNTLVLRHIYEGRELNSTYMEATLKHIFDLWKYPVELNTVIDKNKTKVCCEESKKISYTTLR